MLGYKKIADYTVSGSAITSYSFTGLNITKNDEYMLVCDIGNALSGTGPSCNLTINGNNTTTNYNHEKLIITSSSGTCSTGNAASFMDLDSTQNTHTLSVSHIKLTNAGIFVAHTKSNESYDSSTLLHERDYRTVSAFTATSITELAITCDSASAISVGSRFQLYKCTAKKVSDITVGTAATSVDITGLDIDKTGEYMLIADILGPGAGDIDGYLCVNGNNTLTNYYAQRATAIGTAVAGARSNNSQFYDVNGAGNSFYIITIKISANGYFVYQASGSYNIQATPHSLYNYYGCSTFTMTNITSITISASAASGIGVGTRLQLYKLK